jgi:DnaB-like helicase N terminal domain/AAA domain
MTGILTPSPSMSERCAVTAQTGANAVNDVTAPPHSQEAEMGVLASMLQPHDGSEAIAQAMAKIGPEHFYIPAHQTIFIAICDLYDAEQAIDLITFTQSLRERKLLDSVGGAAFVTNLFTFVPTAANVQHYIEIVRDKYILRSIIFAGKESVRRAYEQADEPETLLEEMGCRIDSLRSIHGRNGSDLWAATNLIALADKDPVIFEIDNLLGNRFLCVEGGMLFVGPSGSGKSSAGVQQDVAWSLGRPAFGIKPSRPLRILTIQAENDDGDLAEMARGICDHLNLTLEERTLVGERVVYVKEKALTGDPFLRLVRRLVRKYKPDLIRLDPLQAYAGGDVRDPAVQHRFFATG